MNFCIIGHGFVGKAISRCFSVHIDVNIPGTPYDLSHRLTIVDPAENKPISRIKGEQFDVIFIAVPTPSNEDGTIDSSIVESVLRYVKRNVKYEVIAIKSTLTPDLVRKYCKDPKIVYNPEFLTERNATQDFSNASFHVIGSNSLASGAYLERAYRSGAFILNGNPTYIHVTPEEASFIKYGINSFLASKVAWFNQFYDVMKTFGLSDESYKAVAAVMAKDPRVAKTHMTVPGWDGSRGFGGACFPKDIPAFIHFSKNIGYTPTILHNSWNYNVTLRTGGSGLLDREIAQNIQYKKIT